MTQQFTILAVCTGNICRSPAMERLLAHVLGDEPDVQVISGGTYAHDGWDMQKPMKKRVTSYGATADDFVAEQTTPDMIRSADLVLAATREHVADMLTDVPEVEPKTFTIRQFGRILQKLDSAEVHQGNAAEKLAALVELAEEHREEAGQPSRDDDVVDPYMLPDDVYDQAFEQIIEPIEALKELLR